MNVLVTTLNAQYVHSSLAIRYLQSYCRSAGLEIQAREYTINHELLDILADIYSARPDVLGLACYIWNIEMSLKIACLLKKVLPDTVIVLGGPEVTYGAEEILTDHPCIDCIVRGEGEETFCRLLLNLSDKASVQTIEGIACRQENGTVLSGSPGIITDLDTIPFPYSEQDAEQLKDKIIYYESSRGCPFSCQYCLSGATQGVRFFSPERVCQDLQRLIAADVKQVKFVDRTFNAGKEHFLPIVRFLARQPGRTNFHFEIAADLLDEEAIDAFLEAPAGRFQMEIGVQSTNEPTLAEIRRKNQWEKIVENVGRIREAGTIHLHLDLIVGLPYESIGQFARSFNAVFSLKPHQLQIGFLKLLKGSGIRANAAKHQYRFMDWAPYEVLANDRLSYGDVRQLKILEAAFNYVYNGGRFHYLIDWLVTRRYKGDAFAFFWDLAGFWEAGGLHLLAHGPKNLYKHLRDFCNRRFSGDLELCLHILKADALTADQGQIRPDFLPWDLDRYAQERNVFWRDEEVVSRYLPQFKFTNWRELNKRYHIEVFGPDAASYLLKQPVHETRPVVVLFSYDSGSVCFQAIEPNDFFKGEST